jgi:hypothetical protein
VRWPWVSRKRLAVAEVVANEQIDLHIAAKRNIAGMVTAIAMRDQEIDGLRVALANQASLNRDLETKQRDLEAPQMSAADLEALHKQHAFRIRQCEAYAATVEKLEAELDRLKRPRSAESAPSPVALVPGSGR